MGWLPAERVITVSRSGLYKIGQLETPQTIAQVLVIPRRDDPTQAVHLSLRQAVGFDATLPPEFVGRTSVHQFAASCPNVATTGTPPKTMLTKTLGDGDEFTDEGAGLQIAQTQHDATSATLRITFMQPAP